jgi:hypothetical protein
MKTTKREPRAKCLVPSNDSQFAIADLHSLLNETHAALARQLAGIADRMMSLRRRSKYHPSYAFIKEEGYGLAQALWMLQGSLKGLGESNRRAVLAKARAFTQAYRFNDRQRERQMKEAA